MGYSHIQNTSGYFITTSSKCCILINKTPLEKIAEIDFKTRCIVREWSQQPLVNGEYRTLKIKATVKEESDVAVSVYGLQSIHNHQRTILYFDRKEEKTPYIQKGVKRSHIDQEMQTYFQEVFRYTLIKDNDCWPFHSFKSKGHRDCDLLFVHQGGEIRMELLQKGTNIEEYVAAKRYVNIKEKMEKKGEYPAQLGEALARLNMHQIHYVARLLLPGEFCSWKSNEHQGPYFLPTSLQLTKDNKGEVAYRYFTNEKTRAAAHRGLTPFAQRRQMELELAKRMALPADIKTKVQVVFQYETQGLARKIVLYHQCMEKEKYTKLANVKKFIDSVSKEIVVKHKFVDGYKVKIFTVKQHQFFIFSTINH